MKPASPSENPETRILVVDDHPLFRQGVAELIAHEPGWVCCGQAGNVREAWAAVERCQPHLVLLDLRLGASDGLDLLADLTGRLPHLPVLILSQCDELVYAERALRAGARGYIMKDQATEEIVLAVRSVLAGKIYASRLMGLRVLQRSIGLTTQSERSSLDLLSTRELQVFQRLGAGLSTREIAVQLHLSHKTIETHRDHIKQKFGLPNAAALVRCASAWVETEIPPGSGSA